MRTWTMAEPQFADRPDLHGAADTPVHAQITAWLEALITSSVLAPGDRLPSEVEFAEALGVSRMTLRQALAAIEARGLIDRRRGRSGGNFVCSPRFEFDHASLPGFTEQMRRIQVEAGARVLRARTVRPPSDVRRHLELTGEAQVHEVLRARSANGEPIVLEHAYLPAAVFPDLLAGDLTGSLYSLMRGYGSAPFSAEEQIEAVRAEARTADLLGIPPGDPVLLITRTARTEDGVAVEFSRDHHRSDRTRIRITAQVGG
ncbi:GntR family transcriptional regulator [Mycobacterium sp. WMMD1722]|uniref:GntR family transcriptional regulator n=1 Tax=Mycobacterium sp. WMMD1722 TaxID=3404117 RepID=UPI003BF4BC92